MTEGAEEARQIPRIYLDQNVLSRIADGELEGLKDGFVSGDYQLIYFDETINEILRCGQPSFHQKALDGLAEMKGMHLRIKDDETAAGTNLSPYQLFEEAKSQDGLAALSINAMQQFIFKIFGGRQGENIADVLEGQKQAFSELMDDLNNKVSALSEEERESVAALNQFSPMALEAAKESLNQSIDRLARQMEKDIPDPESFDGPKAWQEHVGVGAEQLNNIEPSGVIGKIWDHISANGGLPEQMQNQEAFLKLLYGMPQDEVQPSWADKIRGLYFFLNFGGYWPDRKRRNWEKFVGMQSDMNHAVYGAYANVVISADERFVKKTAAIYEYLGLNTKVLLLAPRESG